MKVSLNNQEVELKNSFRSLMIYEKMTGENFNPKGISEIILYFYATICASWKECNVDVESFIDWLDENPEQLNEFSKWMSELNAKNESIKNEDKVEVEGEVEEPKN